MVIQPFDDDDEYPESRNTAQILSRRSGTIPAPLWAKIVAWVLCSTVMILLGLLMTILVLLMVGAVDSLIRGIW